MSNTREDSELGDNISHNIHERLLLRPFAVCRRPQPVHALQRVTHRGVGRVRDSLPGPSLSPITRVPTLAQLETQ